MEGEMGGFWGAIWGKEGDRSIEGDIKRWSTGFCSSRVKAARLRWWYDIGVNLVGWCRISKSLTKKMGYE